MAGIRIEGNTSGNVAEVNSSNQLKITAETNVSANPGNVGAVRIFSENDPGTLTGSAYLKSPEVSADYRVRAGLDTLLFSETFNATAQNTSTWSYTFNTLTAALPGAGTLNFSVVQGTTSAHGAFVRTFRYFPLFGTAPTYVEFTAGQFTAALVNNEVFLGGLGLPSAATTPPTDGVWFQLTTAGLIGVLNFNGSTTQTGVLKSFNSLSLNTLDKYTIVIGEQEVEFWFDDIFLGELAVPASNGQPFITTALPLFFMKYNTGAVSNTNTMRISDTTVSLADLGTSKPWSHQLAAMGQQCYQGQNGNTMGSTQGTGTVTTGSTPLPTGAAGSNTAANVTGLGGTGAVNAAAGGGTDYIATSYQVPAGSINITPRTLYITGVRISAINTGAAVATTPTTLQWSIGYGHTAVSMATTETGSFATATTKAPRRILLGFQSAAVGAAIGTPYSPDISMTFNSPIVVNPGEFINTHFKQAVGTATASQTITYIVTFDGYFE